MKMGVVNRFEPGDHSAMWPLFAQLRDDVGIKQVHSAYSSLVAGRRRALPRGGTSWSVRAVSVSSNCLSEGRAAT